MATRKSASVKDEKQAAAAAEPAEEKKPAVKKPAAKKARAEKARGEEDRRRSGEAG